jgi:hypothetical protein
VLFPRLALASAVAGRSAGSPGIVFPANAQFDYDSVFPGLTNGIAHAFYGLPAVFGS